MNALEAKELMTLNNIIYQIYAEENLDLMREQLLVQLRSVMDYDAADFYLAEDVELMHLAKPIFYNCMEETVRKYKESDFLNGIMPLGRSGVYRETDQFTEEARRQRSYYQNVCVPHNWDYSVQIVLGMKRKFLGVVTFYRNSGKENFQYEDMLVLNMLRDHLAYRLYQNEEKKQEPDKLSISKAVEQFGLTKREHTILIELLAGKDNETICEELFISVNTLKKHILNIYRKLGIKNRVQLFKMIREQDTEKM